MKYHTQLLITLKVITLLLLGCSSLALAGPPFVTDDPEPVEYQHWEVNYAATKSWRHQESSVAMPSIDINYGLTPDLQIHAQPRYSFEKTQSNKSNGFDNTEVGIKYRFINIDYGDASVMVGTYPMIEIPTGDSSLRPNMRKTKTFIPAWIQFNKDKWSSYGGIGYRINPGVGNQNSWYFGTAVLYQFTPSVQLGSEVFYETADSPINQSITGFNLGGRYQLIKDYNLLFSAGKGLANIEATNKCSVYLALQIIY
jgi:hypothetical protein